MTSKKDMRRDDLIIPFTDLEKDKEDNSASATLAQTMPMAAMFMRNKMVGWVAVVFSIQHSLSESQSQKSGGTPSYFSVLMSLVSLVVTYMPLFLPPPSSQSTSTQAQTPVPPVHQ